MNSRRDFIKTATFAGIGMAFAPNPFSVTKVGIIGLDTEHSLAFTKILHEGSTPALQGFKVVAAYPYGSKDIEFCIKTIPVVTGQMKELGIKIANSIESLLNDVDVVLLETNDGRLHREQAIQVIKAGKPLFIDKPIAASLADAKAIFEAAKLNNVPVFSASSLRYMEIAQQLRAGKIGNIIGADTYGPATIEKTHPDLFWYGIHGIEALFTVMGTGCKSVSRIYEQDTDIVVGTWNDGRIGTFRGIRKGEAGFGGTVFGEKGISPIGTWDGYKPLVIEIAKFFRSGVPPVDPAETLEIFAFMEAAEISKRKRGKLVSIPQLLSRK